MQVWLLGEGVGRGELPHYRWPLTGEAEGGAPPLSVVPHGGGHAGVQLLQLSTQQRVLQVPLHLQGGWNEHREEDENENKEKNEKKIEKKKENKEKEI